MSIIQGNAIEDASYAIKQSLRFRAGGSAYLSRTFGSNVSYSTWTKSLWTKRGVLGVSQAIFGSFYDGNSYFFVNFTATDAIQIYEINSSVTRVYKVTSAVFRDVSAHYHIVFTLDTTNAIAEDRIRLYVNGVRIVAFSLNTPLYSSSFACAYGNTAYATRIGQVNSSQYLDGYLSEINFIDGQALDPSSFGQTDPVTGVWIPKKYTGTYGTNGFYLPFNDATSLTTLGYDRSGNGNNWTCNGISITAGAHYDVMKDSPTNGAGEVGNYATLNPLSKSSMANITSGNLMFSHNYSGHISQPTTISVSSGLWYFEATIINTGNTYPYIGIATADYQAKLSYLGSDAISWGYAANGMKSYNGVTASYGSAWTTNDIVGCALDLNTGTVAFYKNGVAQGVAFSGLSGAFMFAISGISTQDVVDVVIVTNFGQRPFAYTPPTGFKPLHTGNLPDATPVTTSGTFTGNASTDGPCIFINGTPTAMTINSNAVAFAAHADKLAGGFKVRSSSASYNASGTNTYSITTNSGKFKNARAQANP